MLGTEICVWMILQAEKHSVSEHVLDVPISERFLKMEILENYGSRGSFLSPSSFGGLAVVSSHCVEVQRHTYSGRTIGVGFFRIEFHGFRP